MGHTGALYDEPAEVAVLGCLLIPSANGARDPGGLRAEDFYSLTNGRIFRACQELAEAGEPVDALTVSNRLQRTGQLAEVGGRAFIHSLADAKFPPTNLPTYAGIVRDHSRRRAEVRIGQSLEAGELTAEEAGRALEALRSASAAPTCRFWTPDDLTDEADPEPVAVVPGYIFREGISELVGPPKGGKTTLTLALAAAVSRGDAFFGQPTLEGPVIYLTEERHATMRSALRRVGLEGGPRPVLMFRHEVATPWAETIAQVRAEAKRIGAILLVVDTLTDWAGLAGEAENNAGDALAAVRPLQAAAADGLAVLTLRHERKGGGELGASGRGSSAFAGAVDVLLQLRRMTSAGHENRRELLAVGRFDHIPPKLVIEFEGSEYRALGDADALERQETRRRLLDLLPSHQEGAQTFDELLEDCGPGIGRTTVHRALQELLEAGDVQRAKGAGSAGARGFGWWLRKEAE